MHHPFSHRNKHSLNKYSNQIDLFKYVYFYHTIYSVYNEISLRCYKQEHLLTPLTLILRIAQLSWLSANIDFFFHTIKHIVNKSYIAP